MSSQKIQAAKTKICMKMPFFASLLLNYEIDEDAKGLKYKTACTDGQRIYFDKDFLQTLDVPKTIFVICHEILHIIFEPSRPRGSKDKDVWALAIDLVINNILVKEGLTKFPPGIVHDPEYANSLDNDPYKIYEDLMKRPRKYKNFDEGNVGRASTKEETKKIKEQLARARQAQVTSGLEVSTEFGKLLDRMLKTKVNWKDYVRTFCTSKIDGHRSWSRLNKRMLAHDQYSPTVKGESVGKLVVARDWSGSISKELLEEFTAHIRHLKEDLNPSSIHILDFHTEVFQNEEFQREEEFYPKMTGQVGGTCFRTVFEFIQNNNLEPEHFIMLTDLECDDFGPTPEYPVLFVSNSSDKAPFGQVVMIE